MTDPKGVLIPHDLAVASVALAMADGAAGTAPDWIKLLPKGAAVPGDGRDPWNVPDPQQVVARSMAGSRPLPIDFDHAIDRAAPEGRPAPAAGWITLLEARADGVWAKVEWTPDGAKALADKSYRFISPTFTHAKDRTVWRIYRAALTNNPALITLPALASADNGKLKQMNETLSKTLKTLLGLPDTADDAAIVEAVQKLTSQKQECATAAVQPDPAKFVPIGLLQQTVAELNRVNQGVTREHAEATVAMAANNGMFPPFLREWAINLCTVNKPAFEAFVKASGPSFYNSMHPPSIAKSTPPPWVGGAGLSPGHLALCRAMNLTPEEYSASMRMEGE